MYVTLYFMYEYVINKYVNNIPVSAYRPLMQSRERERERENLFAKIINNNITQ